VANPIAGTLGINVPIKNHSGNIYLKCAPADFCVDPTNAYAFVTSSGSANFATIQSGPYTLPLSNATVTLSGTNTMPTAGTIFVNNGSVIPVTYTGISGSTITGCNSGGTGTLATGNNVSMPGTIFRVVLATGALALWYQDPTGVVTAYYSVFYDTANSQLVAMDQSGNLWGIPFTGTPPVQSGSVSIISSAISNLNASGCTFSVGDLATNGIVWQSGGNREMYGFAYQAPATTTLGFSQFESVQHPFTWYGGISSNFLVPGGTSVANGLGVGANVQKVAIMSYSNQVVNVWESALGTDVIVADAVGLCNSTGNGATPGIAMPVGTISNNYGACCWDTTTPQPLLYMIGNLGVTPALYSLGTDGKTVTSIANVTVDSGPILKMVMLPTGGYTGGSASANQVAWLTSDSLTLTY
jgi:hypothetical protein